MSRKIGAPEAEPLVSELSARVDHAKRHMLEAIQPEAVWMCVECGHETEHMDGDGYVRPRALKIETKRRCGESLTVVNIAFWNHIESGDLAMTNDLRVRRAR